MGTKSGVSLLDDVLRAAPASAAWGICGGGRCWEALNALPRQHEGRARRSGPCLRAGRSALGVMLPWCDFDQGPSLEVGWRGSRSPGLTSLSPCDEVCASRRGVVCGPWPPALCCSSGGVRSGGVLHRDEQHCWWPHLLLGQQHTCSPRMRTIDNSWHGPNFFCVLCRVRFLFRHCSG